MTVTDTEELLERLQQAAEEGAARAMSREELFRWNRVRQLIGGLRQR